MGLMDAVASGASAAANAAADYYGKSALAEDLARVQTEKAMRVEEYKASLAKAPLKRFGAEVSEQMKGTVPVTPERASRLAGDEISSDGKPGAFAGDIAEIRRQLMSDASIPEDDRRAALEQLNAQEGVANKRAADAVAGQTRALTRSEAERAAQNRLAESGDYEALTAGRAATTDKYMKVGGDDVLIDTATGKEVFRNTATTDRTLAMQDRLDSRQSAREDRRDERLAQTLSAREAKAGDLTLSQRVKNKEIDAARRHIAGMTAEDIRRKTSPTTATGRDNPDYDPQLSRRARMANQRKYGDDDWFDAQGQLAGQSPVDDVRKRFSSDAEMKGYELGRETPDGFEVRKNGRLVGYYD